MAIRVKDSIDKEKLSCYIILDSLGHRETWAGAIRLRCDVDNKLTLLRPCGIAGSRLMSVDDSYYNEKVNPPAEAGRSQGLTVNRGHQSKKQKNFGQKSLVAEVPVSSGNANLDAAIEQFGVSEFKEEKWVHEWLQKHSVSDLPGECDQLERWIDVIKNGLRGAVLDQYEYFVEASKEMSTERDVAWIRTLVKRQQETLMSMRNIDFGAGKTNAPPPPPLMPSLPSLFQYFHVSPLDFGAGFEAADDGVGDEEYGYLSEEDGLLDETDNDALSYASSVVCSSSDEESNPINSRTPMRRNLRRESRKKAGNIPLEHTDEYLPAIYPRLGALPLILKSHLGLVM
jgi:hypothetical protein